MRELQYAFRVRGVIPIYNPPPSEELPFLRTAVLRPYLLAAIRIPIIVISSYSN